jgi:phospholipase/carboxylesterase
MNATFSGPSFGPASGGKPDSIVVLIHGYGANGDDLLSLGKSWASLLPNTLFVAPHGPEASKLYPAGNQWFSLEDWNPEQPLKQDQLDRVNAEIKEVMPSFNSYLDDLLKVHGIPPEKMALVGFSQGTMFALQIALHRPLCGGVVGYSGALLELPREDKVSRPPVLLIHGVDDPLVPSFYSKRAEKYLQTLDVPVTLTLLSGLEHSIDGRGLAAGGAFLKEKLYEKAASGLSEQVKESNNL